MSAPQSPLTEVMQNIAAAAKAVGRDAGEVTLVAVSKTFDAPVIQPVIDEGQRVFGENRVQEAMGKWPDLKAQTPDLKVHLIGPLQSNKTKEAVQFFDAVHSVDRPKLARKLAEEAEAQGRCPALFVQVNTGEEPQKAGVLPLDADAFIARVRGEFGLPLAGLMCIPPAEEAPAPHFALLRKIAEENGLAGLSMGMSGDYVEAVRMGATHVRVGSAIFGARTAIGH